MAQASKKIDKYGMDELNRIKKNINNSYLYYKENYDRFHKFRRFVFSTSLEQAEKDILNSLKKPIIEFNILEAYISRLLGEFAKHEPSIEIIPADGQPVDIDTIKVVEGHLRHIIYEANKNSCSYEVYKDLLSGGFSAVKVWTDYATSMSFDQVIKLGRVFDPTLCGFDPLARHSHKGDGRYCYEIFPLSQDDFDSRFPDADISGSKFARGIEGFNWSYKNGNEKIIILAEYFEKKKKKARIVKLSNGRVMTDKNYQKFEQYWKDEQFIAQIPAVVGKSRMTDLEIVCRYKLIESEILEYKETDYTFLPLIFVSGNSIILRDGDGLNNTTKEMTRPYVYHAEGIQKLKNFAGQTLANELENMIQHKIIICEEAIPQQEQYAKAYNNVQQASTYVWSAYNPNLPDQQLPAPREVMRTPIPQEVMATYGVTDSTTQVILGSFDAALGINDNQLSGVAIQTAATQSNAAAMPYVTGYLQAWTHIACFIVSLMPLYLVTPRTIPVVGIDGKRDYKKINQPGQQGAQLDYDEGALQVYIEAGVNFQIQKNQALQQIVALMQASEAFAKFMNGPGLSVLVSNLTIYQADVLKEAIPKWEQQQEQQQQQMQQQQMQMMQSDPRMITAKAKAQKDQQDGQIAQEKMQSDQQQQHFENQVVMAKLQLSKEQADAQAKLDEAQLQQDSIDSQVQILKAQAEIRTHAIDAAGKIAEHHHKVLMDKANLAHTKTAHAHDSIRESVKLKHEIDQANKPQEESEDEQT